MIVKQMIQEANSTYASKDRMAAYSFLHAAHKACMPGALAYRLQTAMNALLKEMGYRKQCDVTVKQALENVNREVGIV